MDCRLYDDKILANPMMTMITKACINTHVFFSDNV